MHVYLFIISHPTNISILTVFASSFSPVHSHPNISLCYNIPMNYWQQFCNSLSRPLTNEQELVNATVASLREILGWSDITLEFPVQVGHETKRGDIMFADNSIIIEAKRQGITLYNFHILQQLKSYLRVKYKRFGFLIGDELWFFYDDYADDHEDLKFINQFNFTDPDNPAANELMTILAKPNFSVSNLMAYCDSHWSGKYLLDLLDENSISTHSSNSVQLKSSGARNSRTRAAREPHGFWDEYWQNFQTTYQAQDSTGILAAMRLGQHNDLYAPSSQIAKLLGQPSGVQFGLAKGNRPGTRKVEIRLTDPAVFQTYFAHHLDDIIHQIANLGGTYAPQNPDKVINCYFPVSDDTAESYPQIFAIYTKFQQLILKYLKKED